MCKLHCPALFAMIRQNGAMEIERRLRHDRSPASNGVAPMTTKVLVLCDRKFNLNHAYITSLLATVL
jgi:hypothetical protein